MSILIKGMEIPECCFDCPCYHHKVDEGYYDYEICGASRTIFNDGYSSVTGHKDHINPFKARLDNCPLVPVPPHGRLIDADALLQSHSVSDGIYFPDAYIPATAIKAAPTIIPAEEADCHTSDTVTGSR